MKRMLLRPSAECRRVLTFLFLMVLFSGRSLAAETALSPAAASAAAPKESMDTAVRDRLDFAAGLYGRNMYEMAEREYRAIIEEYPAHTMVDRAFLGLAETYFFSGDYARAAEAYQDFLKRYPGHAKTGLAHARLAEAAYHSGDREKARQLFESIQNNPDPAASLAAAYYLGKLQFEAENHAAAAAQFEKVIQAPEPNPFREFSFYYLAELALEAGDLSRARESYEKIRATTNTALQQLVISGLGKTAFASGQFAEARRHFLEAYALQAEPAVTAEVLLNALKAAYNEEDDEAVELLFSQHGRELSGAQQAEAFHLRASSLSRQEQYAASNKVLDDLIKIDEAEPEQKERARLRQGENLLLAGKPEDARRVAESLNVKDSAYPDRILFLKGEAARRTGQGAEAVTFLDQLVTEFPDSPYHARALFSKAYGYLDAGEKDSALEGLVHFQQKFPDHEWAPKALADAMLIDIGKENWPEAIQKSILFLTQYASDERARTIHYRLASLYTEAGQYQDAYAVYETHKSRFQGQNLEPDLEFFMGYVQQLAGNLEQAAAHYQHVDVAALPEKLRFAALKNQAYSLMKLERYGEAAETYRKLLENFPASRLEPAVFFWLADYYAREGDFDAMLAVLEKFRAHSDSASHEQEFQYYLGEAYRLAERCEEALTAYAAARAAGDEAFTAEILYGQGRCYAVQENYEESLRYLEEALRAASEQHALAVNVRMDIGRLWRLRGEPREAAKAFMAVAILYEDPEHVPVALYEAAEAFRQAGEERQADTAVDELLERFPEHPLSEKVRQNEAAAAEGAVV